MQLIATLSKIQYGNLPSSLGSSDQKLTLIKSSGGAEIGRVTCASLGSASAQKQLVAQRLLQRRKRIDRHVNPWNQASLAAARSLEIRLLSLRHLRGACHGIHAEGSKPCHMQSPIFSDHAFAAVTQLPALRCTLAKDVQHLVHVEPGFLAKRNCFTEALHQPGNSGLVDHLGELARAVFTHQCESF